jgi:hypothetical protein
MNSDATAGGAFPGESGWEILALAAIRIGWWAGDDGEPRGGKIVQGTLPVPGMCWYA